LGKRTFKYVCIDTDEWTSVRNRRYLNVTVYTDAEYWNLGLARITGKATSNRLLEIISRRLLDFDISMTSDVVCVTSDGAPVMCQISKLSGCLRQLCIAHGIQLAVLDVLYERKVQDLEESESDDDLDDESGTYEDASEIETVEEDDDDDRLNVLVDQSVSDLAEATVKDLVKKVRELATFFKRSPASNEILQKYVVEKLGSELTLIVDCKTRWSSLHSMLVRFVKICDCIENTLKALGSAVTISRKEK